MATKRRDPTHLARQKRHIALQKKRAFDAIGRRCHFCGKRGVHAAHVRPTLLHGAGRGNQKRWRDVLDNPSCYEPMCVSCHRKFDKLVYALFQLARGKVEEPIPF